MIYYISNTNQMLYRLQGNDEVHIRFRGMQMHQESFDLLNIRLIFQWLSKLGQF